MVVVASVSCIYGLGLPSDYLDAASRLTVRSARERQTAWRREKGDAETEVASGGASGGTAETLEPLKRSLSDVRKLLDRMLYSVPENGVDLARGTYTISYHDMSMKVGDGGRVGEERGGYTSPRSPLLT